MCAACSTTLTNADEAERVLPLRARDAPQVHRQVRGQGQGLQPGLQQGLWGGREWWSWSTEALDSLLMETPRGKDLQAPQGGKARVLGLSHLAQKVSMML